MPRVPDDARQLEELLSSGCVSGFSQVQRDTLKELAGPDGWRFSRAVDVCGLLALRPCFDVVDYLLVFLKRPEAAALNFRVVSKQIFTAVVRFDETEALGVVESLDCTCCHCAISSCW
jgi:hypothetical protein